jgi:hypothetical protein
MLAMFWYLVPVAATALLHSLGTALIVVERPWLFSRPSRYRPLRGSLIITIIILVELLVLHLIEIGVWGLALWALGVRSGLKASLYFAGACYTTLGYYAAPPPNGGASAEVVLGMMGMLMFGWSTGILITTVIRYEKLALGWDSTGP